MYHPASHAPVAGAVSLQFFRHTADTISAPDEPKFEIIDLRTLVPPDFDSVAASCSKTGRLVVAAEDRAFAGFVRSIQGHMVERFPGMPTRGIGQKNIPGIAQSVLLEEATILTRADVTTAVEQVLETQVGGTGGWSYIPPRYFLG